MAILETLAAPRKMVEIVTHSHYYYLHLSGLLSASYPLSLFFCFSSIPTVSAILAQVLCFATCFVILYLCGTPPITPHLRIKCPTCPITKNNSRNPNHHILPPYARAGLLHQPLFMNVCFFFLWLIHQFLQACTQYRRPLLYSANSRYKTCFAIW